MRIVDREIFLSRCLGDILNFKTGMICEYANSSFEDKDRRNIHYWVRSDSGSYNGLSKETFYEFFIDISKDRDDKLTKLGI